MPQLDPTPWFMILMLSWIVFLTIIPTKIMAHQCMNNPSPKNTKKPQESPWNWVWY
uniref:ATP synthase complex subunit 8 n=1 Tax=Ariosoma meeki TaxID=1043173 RepID=A0A1D8R9V5_9TELE|nr:ATP synthase subunit 8 [Ariosoma meeki]